MLLDNDMLKRYENLTRPNVQMLSRREYIDVIRDLLSHIRSMQMVNTDLKTQLADEQQRRRRLQEADYE